MRRTWEDLPPNTRAAIEEHTGRVEHATPHHVGEHSDITAVLHTATRTLFLKGMQTDPETPDLWALRREARINPAVVGLAPRLLHNVEAEGWHLLAYEHIEARHADYQPGSPDLARLESVIHLLQTIDAPDLKIPTGRRWTDLGDISALEGDTVIHADLNPGNVLITPDDRVFVVDWGFASRGAAWTELALLVQWLLKAGHTPEQAEAWLSRFPTWTSLPTAALTDFAEMNAAFWNAAADRIAEPWARELQDITGHWAEYRRGLPCTNHDRST
ncbi:phosphotransferase family enzyme [Actinocorallia herbida]|uniref:Phosphotransferase family enzyme n=1 Tax=Actinocorallia herbida TaxID=58109 RepID=A0A3N1DAN2_9ACTN|nr:phosphotransferase [Actinocorallia herbida]ROO90591.1 phosphotransferase family enzyme [Actinocorallia herbida]